MTNIAMNDHDDAVYQEIVSRLRLEFGSDLLTVVLTGSAHLGSATNQSDVDICILTRRPFFQRQRRTIGNRRVDIFVDPPERIMAIIEERQTRFLTWMYAHCRILFDPSGVGKSVVARAREIWAEGPSAPPEWHRFKYRSELVDILSNIKQSVDPIAVNYLIGMMLPIALDAYWAENRQWGIHRKRAMELLSTQDPALFKSFGGLLSENTPIAIKKKMAAEVVEVVLGPASDVKAFNEYLGPVITFRHN